MRPCPSIWSSSHRSVSRIPFAIIAFIVFFTEPFSYRFHFLEQRILFFLRLLLRLLSLPQTRSPLLQRLSDIAHAHAPLWYDVGSVLLRLPILSLLRFRRCPLFGLCLGLIVCSISLLILLTEPLRPSFFCAFTFAVFG